MSKAVRKEIERGDRRVSYLEWQSAHPALHFAHANGFNAETYRSLLSPLERHFHVFSSDMRGHGMTTLPLSKGLSSRWAIYCDDLDDFLKFVHPEPLILAGHSMGAIVSLMLAARHPKRVRALILVEPVLASQAQYALMRLSRLARLRREVPDLAERASRRRENFPSFDAALSAYRGRGAFKTWPEQVVRDYLHGGLIATGNGTEMKLACPPAWEADNFRSTPPGVARLSRHIRCPLTIVVGENGTASERELSSMLRRHGSARLVRLPGASHFLPMERPEIVRDEIDRIACLTA